VINAAPSLPTSKSITPVDRLGFTLFMAVALHAVAIMGSSFVNTQKAPPIRTLEITLAQQPTETKPKEADFLAQANQEGSGTLEEKRLLSTTEKSIFQDDKIRDQAALPTPQIEEPTPLTSEQPKAVISDKDGSAERTEKTPRKVVTTTEKKKTQRSPKPKKTEATKSQPKSGQSSALLAQSLEIANLQAQLKMQQEQFAKRPRIRRLTSVSTTIHEDAIYLDNWRRRVEMIGNLNYPEDARKNKLYGTLRVLVSIKPDGSLKNVEILKSSGHKTLDDAAVRIVRLAAPFQPFSVEMRKNTDILEIIRTWKFEKTTHLY